MPRRSTFKDRVAPLSALEADDADLLGPPGRSSPGPLRSDVPTDTTQSPRTGVLLANSRLRPLYCNEEAALILSYPKKPQRALSLDGVLTNLFEQSSQASHAPGAGIQLTSGRRRYLCRAFRLDRGYGEEHDNLPRVVLLLERARIESVDLTRWCEEFQLTNRERETVKFLLKGYSSKEIAAAMQISPNTVKTFLKLVMAKIGASSRTGIVAKIVERLGPGAV